MSQRCLTLKATTTRSLFVATSQAVIVAPVVLVSLFYCTVARGTVTLMYVIPVVCVTK